MSQDSFLHPAAAGFADGVPASRPPWNCRRPSLMRNASAMSSRDNECPTSHAHCARNSSSSIPAKNCGWPKRSRVKNFSIGKTECFTMSCGVNGEFRIWMKPPLRNYLCRLARQWNGTQYAALGWAFRCRLGISALPADICHGADNIFNSYGSFCLREWRKSGSL